MVYKKYIEKNGKLYGPYIYHSRRVNGKVISEYRGSKKDFQWHKFAFAVIGILVFTFMIYAFFNLKGSGLSGNVIFAPSEDEKSIGLSIREGELIPASSKIIFETSDNAYEYELSSLVSETPAEGSYYAEGNILSGEGAGYGIEGEKITYPEVYFSLVLSKQEETNEETYEETLPEQNEEESPEISEESPETTEETENNEETNETPSADENETAEEQSLTGEEIEDIPENPIEQEEQAEEETNDLPQTDSEETGDTITEEEPKPEETEQQESPAETEQSPEEEEESSLITGGVISGIFRSVSNFFLGILRATGFAVSEADKGNEISGEASYGSPFEYSLQPGESIKLISGSVKTDLKELDNNAIKMFFEGNKLRIETDYFETEKGFGEDYLGNRKKEISVSVPEEVSGELTGMKLFYNGENLILAENFKEENKTKIINETLSNKTAEGFSIILTDEERNILEGEFGNLSVLPVKTELFNERYIRGYELGNYRIEYSYSPEMEKEKLIMQIESDRIKWLKDIAYRLSQQEKIHEDVNLSISSLE